MFPFTLQYKCLRSHYSVNASLHATIFIFIFNLAHVCSANNELCTVLCVMLDFAFFQERLTEQKPVSAGGFAHSRKIVEEMEKIGWEK